jgi:hypothetical protein
MMDLTDIENDEYKKAVECHICLKPFDDPQKN